MIISLDWLSSLLGVDLDADEVAHQLAMLGAPVESITRTNEDLRDVVVALVEGVDRHPNADRLTLCQVNNGTEVVEVVCGAPNVTAGVKYPFAPAGSVLPGGLKLKRQKIRGVYSNGMLCSARELELGADGDGILALDTSAEPGTRLVEALGLADVILDVEVTPNRPDLLCHRGVAREVGAVIGRPVKLDAIPGGLPDTKPPTRYESRGRVSGVEVVIEDRTGCARFLAGVIRGVKVGPSPDWLQRRLRAVGQRPINNVVDVTNYMLRELNHPMHAYDLDRLAGPTLVARAAKGGEQMTTLDGVNRTFEPGMVLICDADKPTGIGGVMGGADSEVSEDTTNVVLECAYFDPKRIRSTRSRLGMSTDASYRFERGADIQGMEQAFRRAMAMIVSVAGGAEDEAPVDVYPQPVTVRSVFLRPNRVTHLLGVEIPRSDIESYLTTLGFTVAPKDERYAVQVPGWRVDVTREVDLIEEIARLHGYDAFPTRMQPFRPSSVPDDPLEDLKARCRAVLCGNGLHEARSLSLGPPQGERAQAVLHPLSSDEEYLRTDLITGLARAVNHNWSVRVRDVRLYEIGVVFEAREKGELPGETLRVAAVVTGALQPEHWSRSGPAVDFDIWDVKSLLSEVAETCGPSGSVTVDGDRLRFTDSTGAVRGWAGRVDLEGPPWAAPVFGFEIDIGSRAKALTPFAELPSQPPVERDMALVLPATVSAADVESVIKRRGGGYLESAKVFDEYRGDDIEGRSVAWRLTFRARDKTLREKEVDAAVQKILKQLQEELHVQRR